MLLIEEFVFTLSADLEFQDKNIGDVQTRELKLKAPVSKHERQVSELQQRLMKAITSAQKLFVDASEGVSKENTQAPDEEDISTAEFAPFILSALRMSNDDFFEYKNLLYKLLCSDLCFVEGSQGDIKITRTLIDDIGLKDKDRLVGEYSANFIMP